MNRVIHFFALAVSFFFLSRELYAQSNSLFFMKGIPQTKEMNPARHGLESGFYVSMPFLSRMDISANTNGWRYNDLAHRGAGNQLDSMMWDFDHLLNTFGKENLLQESASLTFAEIGWRKKQNFFSFGLSEHEMAEIFFQKQLAAFLIYGNAPYAGEKYNSGDFGLSAMHYRQLSFTFSKVMNKKLSLGITGKMLFGLAGLDTRGVNFDVDMNSSADQITLKGSGNVFLSAPVELTQDPNKPYDLQVSNAFNTTKYMLNFGNPGFALDLGLTYKVNKHFELSLSLIDIGFIRWRNGLSTFIDKGNYLFDGLHLNVPGKTPPTADSFQPLVDNLTDSIMKAFPLELTSQKFSTLLPAKFFVGGEYKLLNKVSLGALARIRMFRNQIHGSYTATVNTTLADDFCFSIGYTYDESSRNNLGLGLSYTASPFQIYAVTDNVFSPFYPNRASNLNLSVGINFVFPEQNRIDSKRNMFVPEVKRKRRRH